jgi:hypothetical protein
MSIDATLGDQAFEKVWPGNTTPLPLDGVGTNALLLTGYSLYNSASSARFVRLFDMNVQPTIGTSVPNIVIAIPATSAINVDLVRGKRFLNSCWVSVTAANSDTDNTAPTASDVQMTLAFRN